MTGQDKCHFKGCKGKVEITYYGKPLCDKHWDQMSARTPDEVKLELGIKRKVVKAGDEGQAKNIPKPDPQ